MKIIEKDFNVITGEETIIEREETLHEKKEREAVQAYLQKLKEKAEAKAAARQTILDRLGLSEEEAKILLG